MMLQFNLFGLQMTQNYLVNEFSFGNKNSDIHRVLLEKKYQNLLIVTECLSRREVSFQSSKEKKFFNWFKYKEGFSPELVEHLMKKMKLNTGDVILDPFMGSGTTAIVSNYNNYNFIGYDILPISTLNINVKKKSICYNYEELLEIAEKIEELKLPIEYSKRLNYINITEGAYPEDTEYKLSYLKEWMELHYFKYKDIINLCVLNSLEELSYTCKDGQYLRWDVRSEKVKNNNQKRLKKGKEPFKTILNKGVLPDAFIKIANEIRRISLEINDFRSLYNDKRFIKYEENSALYQLPKIDDNTISGVITSPPYCNRYDYTRTYALELAFLGVDEIEIKKLRQNLLSCTVENKSKKELLKAYYKELNLLDRFYFIDDLVSKNECLNEIINALDARVKLGDVNNKNIISMVYEYFYELTFIYFELYRVCKPGAKIFFVNDNVRYAGEVIPTDFLSCQLAESIGFRINSIYTIKQQKGNSSQQMKKFGRVPLRKSITEWTVYK